MALGNPVPSAGYGYPARAEQHGQDTTVQQHVTGRPVGNQNNRKPMMIKATYTKRSNWPRGIDWLSLPPR